MSASDAPLAELISRAQQADEQAYRALVELYARRLYGYFFRMTGRSDQAEDLLQEVFLRLVRMLPAYQHDGRFEPWLFRIAANLVRDRARRAKAAVVRPATGMDEDGGNWAEPGNLDADDMQKAEQIDQLQAGLAMLDESDRQILMLRHFGEMSFKQIAGMLDVPLGTALARAHRALGKLRAIMEQSDQDGAI